MSTEYPIFFLGVNLRRLMGSLLIIGASCGGGRTFEKPPQRDEKALGEWRRNEAIVMQAVEGLSDPDELLKAVNFFQDLTGITVRGNTTTFGLTPDQHTKPDLEKLRRWYRRNHARLFWDDATNSVKLRLDDPDDGHGGKNQGRMNSSARSVISRTRVRLERGASGEQAPWAGRITAASRETDAASGRVDLSAVMKRLQSGACKALGFFF